jgi:hypothetical protein
MRKAKALRDRILDKLGTTEPVIEELARNGPGSVAPHWRKPLSLVEINQLAATPEVRRRPGRP